MKEKHNQYNRWVSNEYLEDYSLRYMPRRFRSWSEFTVANTAMGGISFLALEAIGATVALSYGFTNAFYAILFASVVIFLAGIPISIACAKNNIDIDLLTRSCGFGYVGSTVTSLVYASFCFIFFALEAVIMSQALEYIFYIPLFWGYMISSLIIIPMTFYGFRFLSKFQLYTQPLWLLLMIVPYFFVLYKEPGILNKLVEMKGSISFASDFNVYYFGLAAGVSFSLISQIGEQADYLRFMPDLTKENRGRWWANVLLSGPGWIILGFLKQIGGIFFAALILLAGHGMANANEPVHMYLVAYEYVFANPEVVLGISAVFVILSQIKINVTNAYAGSLAWSNFFSRIAHSHVGRVVWVVFNIFISLMLMSFGLFDAIEKVLGMYSNVAISWIGVLVADLSFNMFFGLRPKIIEFKRAHLYNFNPVGVVSMALASFVSMVAFTGVLGDMAQAFSAFIALSIALIATPVMAYLTKGKYYLLREEDIHHKNAESALCTCSSCGGDFDYADSVGCPVYQDNICSLCCSLNSTCKDQCKADTEENIGERLSTLVSKWTGIPISYLTNTSSFIVIYFGLSTIAAFLLWSTFFINENDYPPLLRSIVSDSFFSVYYVFVSFLAPVSLVILFMSKSHVAAEKEINEKNRALSSEIATRKESEEKTRLILSSAGEGIFGVNLKGRVIFINEAACSVLQYDQEEMMEQPVHDLIHHTRPDGSPYPIEECPMQRAFTQGISSRVDNEVLWRKDGTSVEVEYSAVPVMRGDEKMGAVISFQDITARRAAERQRDDAYHVITSSIQYASRIQRSVLPPIGLMEKAFTNHSILWQPRDVVGGDIYWCKQWGDGILFILGDCTGHGVPGAFMTLIATGALDLALLEVEPGDPGRIVALMHKYIQQELGQDTEYGESDDGLELGACYIPGDKKTFTYTGAHFPLFIIENGEVALIKGDKKGIGYRGLPTDMEFTNHVVDVTPARRFFITSDGLTDQVGGPKGRSFGKKRIKNLLISTSDRPVINVSNAVLEALVEYQGDERRRDDLSAIAFEL